MSNLQDIERILQDAFQAAAAQASGDLQPQEAQTATAERTGIAQTCLARLWLYLMIRQNLVETPLAANADDTRRHEAAVYAAKMTTPMVLAECGISSLSDMLADDGDPADIPAGMPPLNPLDTNDLVRICLPFGIDAAAVHTLYVLVANIVKAQSQADRVLIEQLVTYWGDEDAALTPIYAMIAEDFPDSPADLIRAANQIEAEIAAL